MIHLDGMGLLGSMLAWALEGQKRDFTWEDREAPISAWKASTGCIYPSGVADELACYNTWEKWSNAPPWAALGDDLVEAADFWYLSVSPPHGAHYQPAATVGPLRKAPIPSFHLNVREFVQRTRAYFQGRRVPSGSASVNVYAHGFHSKQLRNYLWGWSAVVSLEFADGFASDLRQTVYLRKGRFRMAYAYPLPGTPYWLAGSSTIHQMVPRSLDISGKLDNWILFLTEATASLVQVKEIGELREGWRPVGVRSVVADGAVYLPAMGGDGVRLAPRVIDEVMALL